MVAQFNSDPNDNVNVPQTPETPTPQAVEDNGIAKKEPLDPQPSREEMIQWLQELGVSVMPECPIEAEKAWGAKSAKRPCYWDKASNRLFSVSWKNFQTSRPTPEDLRVWFASAKTQVGCLGGWNGKHWLAWIDFDLHHFESQDALDAKLAWWELKYPVLGEAPKFRSPSGGYRYLIAFAQQPTNFGGNSGFCFTPDGKERLGEVLTNNGGHTLLPPTQSYNGAYQWERWSKYPPVVETPEAIGLYPVGKKAPEPRTITPRPVNRGYVPGAVALDQVLCPSAAEILQFGAKKGKRSDAIAALANEIYGWINWLNANNVPFNGHPYDLIEYAWNQMEDADTDPEKWRRCITKIESDSTLDPAAYRPGGDEACRAKVRKLARITNFRNTPTKKGSGANPPPFGGIGSGSGGSGGEENYRNGTGGNSGDGGAVGLAQREKTLTMNSSKIDSKERLRLDIKALLKETDPIDYEITRSDIQSRYRLNHKAMERIIRSVNDLSKEAELVDMGLDELFDLPTDNIEYVIPGMLPIGEAALLIANPKAGKSLLAYDAAFAVATGEDTFLGEQCKQGKVLIVQCDESVGTAKGRLRKRGLRHEDAPNVRYMHKFRITQLAALEAKLEKFRPTLVIIDSLRKINVGREISENSAEFADNIYALKELCSQYNAALILIHHSNKNNDAIGVEKVRGSSAIAGATWGVWELNQIPIPDPNNKKKLIIDPKDPTRIFSVIARDVEGQRLCIELDPENNHWINRGEPGVNEEDAREQKSHSTKVIELLSKVAPVGLEAREINEQLALGRGIYSVLNRLLGQKIIGSRPSTKDRRRTVYFVSTGTRDDQEAPTANCGNPPPPTLIDTNVIDYSESFTPPDVNRSITVDHNSITVDHTPIVDEEVKQASNVEHVTDIEYSITQETCGAGRGVEPDVIDFLEDDESTPTGTTPFDPYSPPVNVWFEGSYEVFDQFGELIGDDDETEETPLESLKRLMSDVTVWEELEPLLQEVNGTFNEFWEICTDAQQTALNELRIDAGLEPIPVIVIDDAVEGTSETLTETLEDDVEDANQTLTETLGGELIDLSEEASLPKKQVPVWMTSDPNYLSDLPDTLLGNLIRVLDRVGSSEEFSVAVIGFDVELIEDAITMQNTHQKRQQLRKWLGEVSNG